MTTTPSVRTPVGLVALAVAALASWWAWLGWDNEYRYVNGEATGPYQAWQVAGCVLCLAALAFVGGALFGPLVTSLAVTVAFTGAWVMWASARDGDGLWPIGAAMLVAGLGTGSVVVSLLGRAAQSRRRSR